MPRIINWDLVSNPYNWVILVLMVWTGGLALSLLFHHPATTQAAQGG
jgi:hypothetical protein